VCERERGNGKREGKCVCFSKCVCEREGGQKEREWVEWGDREREKEREKGRERE
jgi:hypothetical protein